MIKKLLSLSSGWIVTYNDEEKPVYGLINVSIRLKGDADERYTRLSPSTLRNNPSFLEILSDDPQVFKH